MIRLIQKIVRERRGTTLVELLAGTAIAGLMLVSVTSLEISSWRYRSADEQAFVARAEATTMLDRLTQDVRQSTGYTLLADGAATVTVNSAGGPVTYQWDPETKTVRRQGRVLMEGVTVLQFFQEDSGRTLRAVLTAADGYGLQSRATVRLRP